MSPIFLSYVGLSLVLGGLAAMMDVWSQPTMLDRADGRGKFASPKMRVGELALFAVFIALLWPVFAIVAFVDRVRQGRRHK